MVSDKDGGKAYIQMAQLMLEIGKMIREMDLEFKYLPMEIFTKALG
jgi:hypothetical protein